MSSITKCQAGYLSRHSHFIEFGGASLVLLDASHESVQARHRLISERTHLSVEVSQQWTLPSPALTLITEGFRRDSHSYSGLLPFRLQVTENVIELINYPYILWA